MKQCCFFFYPRYNNFDRSVINTVPHDVVQRWYMAHRELTTELRRPENELWVKLSPGKVSFTSLQISAFRKAQASKQKYKCLSKGQFEMIDLQLQRDWKANREIYMWSKDFTLSCLPWGDFHRQLACPAREGVVHRPEAALRMLPDQRRHPERRALLRPAGLILGKKVPPLSVTWPTMYSESIETPSLFFYAYYIMWKHYSLESSWVWRNKFCHSLLNDSC